MIRTGKRLLCVAACIVLLGAWMSTALAGAQAINFSAQPVGSAAGGQTFTVPITASGTIAKVAVLTYGAPNLDFTAGIGVQCTDSGTVVTAGGSCQQSVIFTPSVPGVRAGAIVLLDATNHVLGEKFISGMGTGGLGIVRSGNVLPFAGNGNYKSIVADGVPALQSQLNQPQAMVVDGAGNVYIADTDDARIRKVTASTGLISTVAGLGTVGYSGDGGPATAATLNSPQSVAVDGAGNIYFADAGNNAVREIEASTGIVTTLAGNGHAGYAGDNAVANSTTTQLYSPAGVAVDWAGNVLIVDTYNQRIRRIDAATHQITTVAGNGQLSGTLVGAGTYSGDGGAATAAGLNLPEAVAIDAAGNLYIADTFNHRIRKVAAGTGVITTVAGTGQTGNQTQNPGLGDGGAATAAQLFSPSGVAVDAAGNLYISDTQHNSIRIVDTAGFIRTMATGGTGIYLDASGQKYTVSMNGPQGLALDGSGNLFFADRLEMHVREIVGNFVALDLTNPIVRQGSKSSTYNQFVDNVGNDVLDLTTITRGTNAALDPAATTCQPNSTLSAGANCVLGMQFAPATSPLLTQNTNENGKVNVVDQSNSNVNAINQPLVVEVLGVAEPINSTDVSVAVTNSQGVAISSAGFGQQVTLVASMSTGSTTGNLTGTVQFLDGTTTIAASVALSQKVTTTGNLLTMTASFPISSLSVGAHTITAVYSGDTAHLPGTSSAVQFTVQEATQTTLVLTAGGQPINGQLPLGTAVNATITVAVNGGGGVTPDGTVQINDGQNTLVSPVQLPASGTYALTLPALGMGQHTLTAVYSGDQTADISGSQSAAQTLDVAASSSISVSSSMPSGSVYGLPVVFTAVVTPAQATVPTGTVIFLSDGQTIASATVTAANGSYVATSGNISSLAVGTHSITAQYTGDLNYSGSTSVAILQQVSKTQTTTTVTAPSGTLVAGAAIQLRAQVVVAQGAATVTGTVTFLDGTTTLGTQPLDANGYAVLTPVFAVGQHAITVQYAGDQNDNASNSSTLALNIVQASTQTVLTPATQAVLVGQSISITAKVTGNGGLPTGTVSFLVDGASLTTVQLDNAGVATVSTSALAVGTHQITASYSGDTSDQSSQAAPVSVTVGTLPTFTTLTAAATAGPNPQPILVAVVANQNSTATAIPTGMVTFKTGTTTLGAGLLDASGAATLTPSLATGSYQVTAYYGGDTNHAPSVSAVETISAVTIGYTLTVTPATITLVSGQNQAVTVSLASSAGFTDTIGLGCSSLPSGVNCHFTNANLKLPANGAASVQLTVDTNNPLGGGATALNRTLGGGLALAALFGILLPGRKMRRRLGWMLLLVAVSLGAVTGCSSVTVHSVAPGTYTFQVTGVGVNSTISHYQNVTLTVTK